MAIKAFTARLVVPSEVEQATLWRTHRIFNERLRWVLRQMHRMKRGESDARHAELFQAITSAQRASAIMEAATSLAWCPQGEPQGWRALAKSLIEDECLLFDRHSQLPGLSKEFRRKLFESAFQMMSGHRELLALWEQEHKEWLAAKAEWEEKHPEYMALRAPLDAFEQEHGQVAKRRQRWHKWLAFLSSHPHLAAWRGGAAEVHDIPDEGKRRIRTARRNKRNRIESEEFFKTNPELAELDKLHGQYQRDFIRPWAKRRNADGFRHRPTFTEPDPQRHPFWYQFKKDATYKNLDLSAGTIRLQLLATDGPEPGWEWHSFAFRPDPRLRRLTPSPEPVQVGRAKYSWVFADPALGLDRPAEIRGAKLMFRPPCPDGRPYLVFTCDAPDLPSRLSLTQKSCDRYSPAWACRKSTEELGGEPPVTCAIDLGIRHLAAATVRRDGAIVRARLLREQEQAGQGPGLPAIGAHKRALSKGRRRRGKSVAGEWSFIDLQRHVDKMGQDRFKKGARRIVSFARDNQCDIILMEKLAGLIPDAERDRGINRALVNWNRGNLAKWIKQLASDAGLRVVELAPHWTSQLCSRCGALGARFSAGRPADGHGPPQAVFEPVGKLFACPDCGYMANADHNASVNLHKRFFGELPKVQKLSQGVYRVTPPEGAPRECSTEQVRQQVRARAWAMCAGGPSPF